MLRYLPDERLPIRLGHPVFRLYFLLGIDASLERRELLGRLGALACRCRFVFLIKALCVHDSFPGGLQKERFSKRDPARSEEIRARGGAPAVSTGLGR